MAADLETEFEPDRPLRPADLARLLLAASGRLPRQRARDQQADRIGEGLRRAILDRLVAIDPEPDDLDAAFAQVVGEMGEPAGPARGVCALIRQEWDAARENPAAWQWLIAEALVASEEGPDQPRRRKRAD